MKKSFAITATEKNNRAQIDIIGDIYSWGDNSADAFREKVKELTGKGITDAHIYINSGGGDCFQANEIENILKAFKGKITGEGGALVASAATYLALGIKDFRQAENGQFMIHKPSIYTSGTEQEIENSLKLLKNMTESYKKAYLAKTTLTEAEFLDQWEKGDWWMTAQEALQNGFISAVNSKVEIDKSTAQMIANYKESIPNKTEPMNTTMMIQQLGLPPTATQEQISEALIALKARANKADQLEATQKAEKEATQKQQINALLDKAIETKTIKADTRMAWKQAFDNDFDNTASILDGLVPVEKLSDRIEGSTSNTGVKHNGKTWEQLQDEDPELLASLETTNPELFAGLFADWKKRNKIK